MGVCKVSLELPAEWHGLGDGPAFFGDRLVKGKYVSKFAEKN
jgi:hypothetical protein